MTIEQIVEYVLLTPKNTNRIILTQMLEQLIQNNQGPSTPMEPDVERVIYDGGLEG